MKLNMKPLDICSDKEGYVSQLENQRNQRSWIIKFFDWVFGYEPKKPEHIDVIHGSPPCKEYKVKEN
tara:strand:+ start:1580 stop:1780 length:201 start_codon:yes stop_codon:yes gene_type:complete